MSQALEQQRNALQELQSTLQTLTAISPESLVRTDQLGTALDFRAGVDVFERTLSLYRSLRDSNLDNVPHNVLANLRQYTTQTLDTLQRIQAFDPSGQNNPASVRDQLVQEVANQYDSHFPHISPIIAYSVRKGTDFDRLEREARAAVDEIGHLRSEVEKRSATLTAEAETTLEQVRRAAAEVGVAQHAIHFRHEADKHLSRSRAWLWTTAALAALTLAYGVWGLIRLGAEVPNLTTAQALQLAVAKLLVFSVLYFGVIWAGRIYKAQWHNHVINQHRQNALSTFETFVKAASDEQTKNAVLLHATQSIFAPQATGFVTQESEAQPTPQVLEIIRSVAGGRPPGT